MPRGPQDLTALLLPARHASLRYVLRHPGYRHDTYPRPFWPQNSSGGPLLRVDYRIQLRATIIRDKTKRLVRFSGCELPISFRNRSLSPALRTCV